MKQNQTRVVAAFFAVCIFTIGLGVITQYAAYKLDYQIELGRPWNIIWGYPIYNPFYICNWYMQYYHYASVIFDYCLKMFYVNLLATVCLSLLLNIWKYRVTKESHTYGSATWATINDLKKAKILDQYGIVLGRFPNFYSSLSNRLKKLTRFAFLEQKLHKTIKFLDHKVISVKHNGPEHVLINAPSRSGKGIGVIVPSLLSWGHSVVVLDIKGENWDITSGFRSKFSHCIYFSPTSMRSAKWNPLLEIRKGLNEVRDVQNIADMLVDPSGSSKQLSHWQLTGHSLAVAAILHVLYAEADKTLSGVANFLADPNRSIYNTLKYMMETKHKNNLPHPVIASAAREMLNKSENELSGVLSTTMSFLGLYRDPVVARNTSDCDFYLDDLMNAEQPISLYIVVPPSDLSRLKPLNRIMINMMLKRLTEKEIGKAGSPHKHRLLLLLDEFPSLGCMDFFKTSLGFLAGYGIKCMLITQSFNNLFEIYGPKNSIRDNCHITLVMAPNDNETASDISQGLGQKTVKRSQINFTGKRLALWLANVSVASQESARKLMNDDEIKRLPFNKVIIMVAQSNPVLADKIMYFSDYLYLPKLLPAVKLDDRQYLDKPTIRKNPWQDVIDLSQVVKKTTEKFQESMSEKQIECEQDFSLAEPINTDDFEEIDADMDFELQHELTMDKEIMF